MLKNSPIDIALIDHVVLRTRHPDRLIAFYRDVMGCPVEREAEGSGLVQLRAGRSLIDIVDVSQSAGRDRDVAHDTGNMDHVCLQLKNWDETAVVEHLRKHGVATGDVAIRYGAQGNGPSLYISDPDGNTVELKGDPGQSAT